MCRKAIPSFILPILFALACGGASAPARRAAVPSTHTPRPTFTPTATQLSIVNAQVPTLTPHPKRQTPDSTAVPTPIPPSTDTPTPPLPTDTPAPPPPPTDTPPPPTPTPTSPPPSPTPSPTVTPAPKPVIKYVLAGVERSFNCEYTAIYGTVKNANNFGLAGVEVRALGIHETGGLEFTARTGADGNYELFRIPLPQLQAGQWAVMVMENGRQVSERFHWASTPVCQSEDTGHSQVLRVDWKLVE